MVRGLFGVQGALWCLGAFWLILSGQVLSQVVSQQALKGSFIRLSSSQSGGSQVVSQGALSLEGNLMPDSSQPEEVEANLAG